MDGDIEDGPYDDGRIWPTRTEAREIGAEWLDMAREHPAVAATGAAYAAAGLGTLGYLGVSAVTSVLGAI